MIGENHQLFTKMSD